MPGGKYGAALSFRNRRAAVMNISGRRTSTLYHLRSIPWSLIQIRSKSAMYPPSSIKLWNPNHGITFASTTRDEASHPRVDLLRSLHTTPPYASQVAEAAESDHETVVSDDDALFFTASEYQSASDTDSPTPHPPVACVNSATREDKGGAEVRGNVEPVEPPITSLDFKISVKDFREAQSAEKDSAKSFWSYALYRGPSCDGSERKVKVHYCRSKQTMERVCQYFVDDKVLGLDLEWSSDARKDAGPKRNVSLIQLANESRIALFHVALFPNDDLVAPTFRKLMENADVKKVGVAIKGDCTRMRTHLGVDTKGLGELSHLYKLVKYSGNGRVDLINKRLVTLASLVHEHLGLPLFKGADVRSSDWSQPLNMSQLMYSASDAYAGFQLYHVLEEKRERLDPTPPRPPDAELNKPIQLADGQFITAANDTAVAGDPDDRGSTAVLSLKQVEAIRESLQIEPEGQSIAESIRAAPIASPKQRQRDPRVTAADEQLVNYRASVKTLRATPSAVRAYYIWANNGDLPPDVIAKILRDPPLQTYTVVSYILEAIKLEKLPFDKKRLRNEILHLLPKEVLQGRYKALMLEAHKPDIVDTPSVA
ncbi:Putative 3'-5' exonuclease domain, ribonuclease H-like superfamily [Colletotrichum destructivum]|uniref:3'-5' exonuclease domain, ribonuclease H-like superfamily n=1 Tax=Colletotrichum destructivum TaxID=34406 RepID=A0AAX4I8T1_9PEZI|nr:Putative 3'-5' exonuclease domain, ribonuclease H-like superfamily [Colletotrichum destructivum]